MGRSRHPVASPPVLRSSKKPGLARTRQRASDHESTAVKPRVQPADDPAAPVRLLLADDHPVVLFALDNMLGRFPHLRVAGRAQAFPDLFDAAARLDFDAAIADFHMPCGDSHASHASHANRLADAGLARLAAFRRRFAHAALIVLTMETDAAVLRRLLELPVDALLSKQDRIDLIPVAIGAALARERYVGPAVRELLAREPREPALANAQRRLSKREREVLALYASGVSVTDIAARLGRSVKTISAQKCSAMRKLSLSNDIALYQFATAWGLGAERP